MNFKVNYLSNAVIFFCCFFTSCVKSDATIRAPASLKCVLSSSPLG